MVETYDATRPRPVESEIQSRIWTAIIITSLAAGITGAVVRHIFDDDRGATRPADTSTTTTPRNAPSTNQDLDAITPRSRDIAP